jgi:predicted ester cyclase
MTDDHVFINMTNNRIEGISNNQDIAWKLFFQLFPDYRNIFERIVVKGSKVIMQGYLFAPISASTTFVLFGLPKSGKIK